MIGPIDRDGADRKIDDDRRQHQRTAWTNATAGALRSRRPSAIPRSRTLKHRRSRMECGGNRLRFRIRVFSRKARDQKAEAIASAVPRPRGHDSVHPHSPPRSGSLPRPLPAGNRDGPRRSFPYGTIRARRDPLSSSTGLGTGREEGMPKFKACPASSSIPRIPTPAFSRDGWSRLST
jgi:hypothetical protein